VGYISVGCFERAREVATALLDVVRRLGLRRQECFALSLLSNALLELGDLDAAARAAEDARRLAADARHVGFSEMLLGRISCARGQHDEAVALLEDALRSFESSPSYRVHALAALAHSHVQRGDAEAGLSLVEQAHDLVVKSGVGGASTGQIALVRAEALAALGRRQEAAVLVRDACQELDRRAAAFNDAWLRSRFLEGIAAHARLRALDRELTSA
jgi:tetratricopeptide (TPR) repeat protein